jgi:malate permease and related proteins
MLSQIFSVIAPVFLIAGIGFLWAKRGMPFDNTTISSLVMNVGSPCLVFSSLTRIPLEGAAFTSVLMASVGILIGALVLGAGLLMLLRQPMRTFLPSLVHPNTGNMGLPLALMAFGDTGLALGISYFFVNSVSQYTLGLTISSGRFSLAQLIRQPIIWSVALALLVREAEIPVPGFLANTTQIAGGLVIPAMLLMLGNSLASLKIAGLGIASIIAVARLALGFGLGLAMISLLKLEHDVAGVVIMQATMPAAVFNYVFAERYGQQPEKVAAVILISTVISFLTLPALVAFAINMP